MKRPDLPLTRRAARFLGLFGAAQPALWARDGLAEVLPQTRLGYTAATLLGALAAIGLVLLADRWVFSPALAVPPPPPAAPVCLGDTYLWAHRWVGAEIGECCGGHVGVRCEVCGQEVEAARAPAMYDAIVAGPPVEPCP